jgi:hypothetical protein
MTRIRLNESYSLTMGTVGTTEAFPFSAFAGGQVNMPAAWTTANLGFYTSPTLSGTYLPYYDDTGTLVQVTSVAASKAFSFPAALYPCRFVKLWSQTGGTVVAQAAARTVVVSLKA